MVREIRNTYIEQRLSGELDICGEYFLIQDWSGREERILMVLAS